MNVVIGTLISSLDKLVKNKNGVEKKESISNQEVTPQPSETTLFSTSIQAKYHILQSKLSRLQHDLSREQARLGILEKENIQPAEVVKISFASSPLFTESIDELIEEKHQLVEKINARKSYIAEQIKSVEIESENIQSIGFGVSGSDYKEKLETIKKSHSPATTVSRVSVERLLKD